MKKLRLLPLLNGCKPAIFANTSVVHALPFVCLGRQFQCSGVYKEAELVFLTARIYSRKMGGKRSNARSLERRSVYSTFRTWQALRRPPQ